LIRDLLTVAATLLAALCLGWATLLAWGPGFDTALAGMRITSNDPLRPLLVASCLFTAVLLAGSAAGEAGRRVWSALGGVRRHVNDRTVAGGVTALALAIGLIYSTTAASGADAYGYVSQADLWLSGSLKIKQPWVADVPWPGRHWTFSPLGYRPADTAQGLWTIVPTYSPGLPLLMAGAKLVGGQSAMFLVVPVLAAVLVWTTYSIGVRLGSPWAGAIGAWLVAASPVFLYMLPWPMTDVPVAAVWAVSFYFLLGRNAWSALAAGLAAGLAILIRPNLFAGAAVFGLWYVLRLWRDGASGRGAAFRQGAVFALGVLPGVIAVALINRYLYGSPFMSGYGGFSDMLEWKHVEPNVRLYLGWLAESETPLAMAGLAALFVPVRFLWPAAPDRSIFVVIGLFVVSLWALYCAYLVFDVWWYLRFLLPTWPFMMIGAGAIAAAAMRSRFLIVKLVVVAAIVWVGLDARGLGSKWSAFDIWQGEQRYPSIARLVNAATERNSVVYSMQHSGSLRYYGGRVTLRYDNLESDWLDRSVAFFSERGVHAYMLVEEWEIPTITRHFKGQKTLAVLEMPPIFRYDGPATVLLFDLANPREPNAPVDHFQETYANLRSVPPGPTPTLRVK
jgi:hypothetical protein